ncbi:MAG: hypothetical protein CM1200mP30_13080 [Pseudomonadota bacterium]|nr:MAG: hypothetical protein CM1200mP30_13080 [Pseudomonadota bacterium]
MPDGRAIRTDPAELARHGFRVPKPKLEGGTPGFFPRVAVRTRTPGGNFGNRIVNGSSIKPR